MDAAGGSIYEIPVTTITGERTTLAPYRGQVMLVVNVASECGFTPQYAGLEALYRRYGARGFTVLGFPCNQFRRQEPGSEAEIRAFCQRSYDVTFPLFGKVEVRGRATHPLFRLLEQAAPGFLWSRSIKWNFTKFLVDRSGVVYRRYSPRTAPERLEPDIERLLGAPAASEAAGQPR